MNRAMEPCEVDITTKADFGIGEHVYLNVHTGFIRRAQFRKPLPSNTTNTTANQDDPAAREPQVAARKPAGDEIAVHNQRQDKEIELGASGA